MHLSRNDLQQLPKSQRIHLINSVTGIKPANLIGTISPSGVTNLAVFSSVVHMGSNPALVGFFMRPPGVANRHTYENIKATRYYTINHIHRSFIERAHQTAAKYDANVSEFTACGLPEQYVPEFPAPFVKESKVKFGLEIRQEIPITMNDTILMIGEIIHVVIPDGSMDKDGRLYLEALGSVGISGLDTYCTLRKQIQLTDIQPKPSPDTRHEEKGY